MILLRPWKEKKTFRSVNHTLGQSGYVTQRVTSTSTYATGKISWSLCIYEHNSVIHKTETTQQQARNGGTVLLRQPSWQSSLSSMSYCMYHNVFIWYSLGLGLGLGLATLQE